MVLDDASSPEFDSDTSPVSDSDPYSTDATSSTRAQLHYNVSPESLSRPFLFPGGSGNDELIKITNQQLDGFSRLIQRPLTTDEATAIAQSYTKFLRTASFGAPFGFIAGNYRAYATRKSFKFPFWSVAEPRRFNPDEFLYWKSGAIPRFIWHGIRHSAYSLVGVITASIVFSSYASSVRGVSDQRDPRLKSLIDLARARARGVLADAAAAREAQDTSKAGQDRNSSLDAPQTAAELWKNHRTSIGDGAGTLEKQDTMVSDQQLTEQEAQRLARPQKPRRERASAWNRQQKEPESDAESQGSYFGLDDASASASVDGSGQQSSSGRSAWDRVRQQSNVSAASSKKDNNSRSEEKSSGTTRELWSRNRGVANQDQRDVDGDNFAFSKSEEERQLAKEEAQKAFDERIERERRGGDFGGNEKGGRWS